MKEFDLLALLSLYYSTQNYRLNLEQLRMKKQQNKVLDQIIEQNTRILALLEEHENDSDGNFQRDLQQTDSKRS